MQHVNNGKTLQYMDPFGQQSWSRQEHYYSTSVDHKRQCNMSTTARHYSTWTRLANSLEVVRNIIIPHLLIISDNATCQQRQDITVHGPVWPTVLKSSGTLLHPRTHLPWAEASMCNIHVNNINEWNAQKGARSSCMEKHQPALRRWPPKKTFYKYINTIKYI